MAQPLIHALPPPKHSAQRRWIGWAVLALLLALSAGWLGLLQIALRQAALWSGFALFAVVLFLTAFNARKKLPFLPLPRASAWMRLHTYAGWFAIGLFLLHIHPRVPPAHLFHVPRGPLEFWLAALFLAVNLSGIIGLVLSRVLPSRLTRHGEEVLFERLPVLRRQLRARVEQLMTDSVAQTQSSTLADFYLTRLKDFFDRPRDFRWHLLGSDYPLRARLAALAALDRFFNEKEREIAATLAGQIRAKDNLDLHFACQGLLKAWLFVHIPLAYSLILVAVVHGFLAWSFTHGG